jgi:RimJ/RimL family protein N-acetyltransferase
MSVAGSVPGPLGLPVGLPVADWRGAAPPPRTPMDGRKCRVEPLDPARHGDDLHRAFRADGEDRIWVYLPYGPFRQARSFRAWLESDCVGADPLFHAIVDAASGRALGMASYLRIAPAAGSIEVGHINYSPILQRTPAATETMFLMMRRVFDELGYRRYEWKCDSLNARSRHAAERLGFSFEGIFRQATVYKGRNRDTAWYSVLDREWPLLRDAFETWLDPANFDDEGRQRRSLGSLIGRAREEAGRR